MKTTQLVFAAALILVTSFAFGATTTLTGTVGDDMCGKKHMMPGKSDAECTRLCVKAGSHYALRVGDKVYKLNGAAAQLDKYAGAKVTITGDVQGDSVQVAEVAPAK